jgi:hypothetical protein
MSGRRTWRDQRVDDLLSALSDLGMSMSRTAAGELLDERVEFVAAQMRVTPQTARTYLTDEALKGLAASMAFDMVEETPGADLVAAPRDAAIPLRLLGRVIAGVGESIRVRLMEREDLEHARACVAQLAHAQGVLGLVIADQRVLIVGGEPVVRVPRALLLRIARYLEAAAELVEGGVIGYEADVEESRGLPGALRRDARSLREAVADPPASPIA